MKVWGERLELSLGLENYLLGLIIGFCFLVFLLFVFVSKL